MGLPTTNFFSLANEGFIATTSGSILSGATTIPLSTVAGLTNASIFVGIIEPGGTKQQVFTGVVDTSGLQITSVVWVRGSNVDHSAGVSIVDYVTGTHHNMTTTGILKAHSQDGTHASGLTLTSPVFSGSIDGWVAPTGTWTYASATTITVPTDATTYIAVGDRLKLTQTTVKYFVVTGVTSTVLTITGGTDYTLTNAAIGSPYYSHQISPIGYPQWFAYTPGSIAWNSVAPSGTTITTAKFSVVGRTVEVSLLQTNTVAGTTNSSFQFGLPITPVGSASKYNTPGYGALSSNTQDVYPDVVTSVMQYDTATPIVIVKYLASTLSAKTVWANLRFQI